MQLVLRAGSAALLTVFVLSAATSQAANQGKSGAAVTRIGKFQSSNKPSAADKSGAVNALDSVPGKTDNPDDGMLIPYKYIGNNFSLKFHKPSCPFAKAMWSGHAELFHFRKEAIAAKYAPCRYCLPPSWTNVSATILARPPQTAAHSASATRSGM